MDSTHNIEPRPLITSTSALEEFATIARDAGMIGIDTEFMRERTYYAQLCLVQLALPQGSAGIDSLALGDLGALRPVMAAPATRKVLHAARQDLEVLWPALGELAGVYDTQVAAALIGLPPQIGYGDLVSRLLGTQLPKTQTRTDWSRRPLSDAQIAYALDDVRYLLPLRIALDERLRALGRLAWFEEEMRDLGNPDGFLVKPAEAWKRLKGLAGLDAGRRELAQQLAAWREERAMQSNRPRGWILPDAALHDIIRTVPRSVAELARTPELAEGILRNSGEQIITIVTNLGLPARLPPLPGRRPPDPVQQDLYQKLSKLTQQIATRLQLAPELLATRRELEQLAAGERDAGPLEGWRRGVVGETLLEAL
jgi:ribonuclease D